MGVAAAIAGRGEVGVTRGKRRRETTSLHRELRPPAPSTLNTKRLDPPRVRCARRNGAEAPALSTFAIYTLADEEAPTIGSVRRWGRPGALRPFAPRNGLRTAFPPFTAFRR